jgi:hypothetical protein
MDITRAAGSSRSRDARGPGRSGLPVNNIAGASGGATRLPAMRPSGPEATVTEPSAKQCEWENFEAA